MKKYGLSKTNFKDKIKFIWRYCFGNKTIKTQYKKIKKYIREKYRNQDPKYDDVEKFKKLIKDMHRGFPVWEYFDIHKKIPKPIFDELLEQKFFIELEPSISSEVERRHFILGVKALPLVSTWESNSLNKTIKRLTIILIILGFLTLYFAFAQTLINYFGLIF